jgi:hypothetical protein
MMSICQRSGRKITIGSAFDTFSRRFPGKTYLCIKESSKNHEENQWFLATNKVRVSGRRPDSRRVRLVGDRP